MADQRNSNATTRTFTTQDEAALQLHSQLEIAPLLEEFARWAGVDVSFTALHYRHPSLGLFDALVRPSVCLVTECSTHHLGEIGDIHFLRESPFSPDEKTALARCVDSLHQPLRNAVLYNTALRQCDGLTQRLKMTDLGHDSAGLPQLDSDEGGYNAQLHHALSCDELTLFYQPKVDLKGGRLTGLEALLRWHHADQGLLSPEQFIPMAERNGLIQAVTRWVLNAVLRQSALWQQQGLLVPVAVNLSGLDLEDASLPDYLAQLLQVWEIPARYLELEITETAAIRDHQRSVATLHRLSKLGVAVAIDDFGIGYSSLQRLKQLPVDTIKIDKSFVMEEGRGEHDTLFVDTIIRLGHQLGVKVVAEGVDCLASWQRLLDTGCDMAQGYHISEPLPGEAMTGWLRSTAAPGIAWPLRHELRHSTTTPSHCPA